jgi:hypothetical protein
MKSSSLIARPYHWGVFTQVPDKAGLLVDGSHDEGRNPMIRDGYAVLRHIVGRPV